ncbi:MAG: hypothetical protein KME42_20610 [Tildeniella nuda ZEHNDER 1965/U140]|jgi:hypothetical protein|nr:hypothetical protein [Tildeniella nuda ZEHNDER 1965/U140]
MTNSLPNTFTGWELKIREKENEIDRSNAAIGKLQGKFITWDTTNAEMIDDEYHRIVGKSILQGEDSTGSLIFSSIQYQLSCLRQQRGPFRIPLPPRPDKFREPSNRGRVRGLVKLPPEQFAIGTKYKLRLEVRAKIIPGVSYAPALPWVDCDDIFRIPSYTPCAVVIQTGTGTKLGAKFYDQIAIPDNSEVSIRLDAVTDAIDFSSQYPGETIQLWFSMAGERMIVDEVTLTKMEFGVAG